MTVYERISTNFGNIDEGRVPFTGRDKERERIKTKIKEGVRVIQINGPPFVGKARLSNQCARELQEELNTKFSVKIIRSTSDSFNEFPVSSSPNTLYDRTSGCDNEPAKKDIRIFVFQNCEKYFDCPIRYKSFVNYCMHILQDYHNTVVCLSSQRNIELGCEFVEYTEQLDALLLVDAVQLLKRAAPSVPNLEKYAVDIVHKCHCLPKIILQVGKFLTKYKYIKPKELLAIWEDPGKINGGLELYGQSLATQDTILEVSQVYKQVESTFPSLRELRVFSGSFNTETAEKVMGYRNDRTASLHCLKKLQDNSLLIYDELTERFKLHSFVHFLSDVLYVGNPSLQTRTRYVRMFGNLLSWMNNELFVNQRHGTISGYVYDEAENIKNVLQQCVIPSAELYPLFFKIATTTDELIVPLYQMDALNFYENMIDAAYCLNKTEDVHILEAFKGKVMTRLGCTSYKAALDVMENAEPHIRNSRNPFFLKFLLSAIGWNYQKQGENLKALRYFEESSKIHLDSKIGTTMSVISKSREVIAKIFLGHYECAKSDTEALLGTLSPEHPVIPILTNGLGLICERSRQGLDEALWYYKKSAYERSKQAYLDPCLPVVAHCNIGKVLSSQKGAHEEGLKHIQIALDICERTNNTSYLLGLGNWYYGRILMQMQQHGEALRYLITAKKVIAQTDYHVALFEVQYHLAKCYIHHGQRSKALDVLNSALPLKDKYIENTPTGHTVLKILQMIVDVDLETSCRAKQARFKELIDELTRLRDILKQKSNLERSQELNQEIFRYSHLCGNIDVCLEAYLYEIKSFSDRPVEDITDMQKQILQMNDMVAESWFATKKRLEERLYQLKQSVPEDRYTLCCSQINSLRESFSESLAFVSSSTSESSWPSLPTSHSELKGDLREHDPVSESNQKTRAEEYV